MAPAARPWHRSEAWTRLVGPLDPWASTAVAGSALLAGAAVGIRTTRQVGGWRGVLSGVVAADLVGGLVTFQLRPTRERYGGSPTRARMVFVASHLQPFVLPLTGQGTWECAAARYTAAVAATAVLEAIDPRSSARRARANGLAVAAAVLDVATVRAGPRWFGPVYLVKLIGGHGGIPGMSKRDRSRSSSG